MVTRARARASALYITAIYGLPNASQAVQRKQSKEKCGAKYDLNYGDWPPDLTAA